jgi:hypothetical protein
MRSPGSLAKTRWIAGTLTTRQLIDNCLHVCLQLTANLAIYDQPVPALHRAEK